ncbi:ligand-binding sensor domain-containing protein [Arachidicoccus terrestris]|uniref:ligand-binding sensor domain-containing protein n=1 Tax=Arachidicoccus terrestris TaxID=2875539 RepID=UPI001CC55084|nr:sensor histidine kinase [Arachidicoccus terrestris]UAY54900.1 GHKL domain-containing protein [Arachidicoccus terrestris]
MQVYMRAGSGKRDLRLTLSQLRRTGDRVCLGYLFCLFIIPLMLFTPHCVKSQIQLLKSARPDQQTQWTRQLQALNFRHYEAEDGLSNNTVICSLQDRLGFMWFGTSDALNRFDGTNFKVFRNDPHRRHSLGSGGITYLFEDRDGGLWVGTSKGGLYFFNVDMDNFYAIDALKEQYVRAIEQDGAGRLWVSAGGKLYTLELPDHTGSHFNKENLTLTKTSQVQYAGTEITSIALQPDSTIWLGTISGELFYVTQNQHRPRLLPSKQLQGGSIERILAVGKDTLLIGTSKKGLVAYNVKQNQFSHPLLHNANGSSEIFVRDILEYKPGQYWVATEEGLFCYQKAYPANGRKERVEQIRKMYGDPYSLSDNALYSICKDREGGVWITSYFSGIDYLANRPMQFEKFYPGPRHHSFTGNVIREITKDRYGHFWIGTEDNGLNEADFKTLRFKNVVPGPKGQAAHTNIHGMLCDGDLLYIGTFEHGIDVMNVKTGEFTDHYLAHDGSGLFSNFINLIYKTSRDSIMVCTSKGIYYFNPSKQYFSRIKALPLEEFYSALTEDQSGRIWVGTHTHGLYYNENGIWKRLKIKQDGKDLLMSTRILFLKADRIGRLWISTESGLYRVTDLKHVQIFDRNHGLPSNTVYTTLTDSLNNTWATTSNGLAKISPDGANISIFNKADGLLNNQFNYQSAYGDTDGYFYFGSLKGLIRFNPYDQEVSHFKPPLYLTDFHIFNQEVPVDSVNSPLKRSIITSSQLELTHKQSTFSFDFAALSYNSPTNLQYAYRIEGLENNWTSLKNDRSIYFTNLPPGNYKLSIRSTNSSGKWMDNQKDINITILPPWWKSRVAYAGYGLLFLGFILLGVTYNNRRHQIRNQRKMTLYSLRKEKELYQSKVDFFTHIAHEIRTPLTLIKGPMEQILKEKDHLPHLEGYIDLMQRNTNRLLSLTKDLLDFRKIESNMTLSLKEMEMGSFLEEFIKPYQAAASDKDIHFLYLPPMETIQVKADEGAMAKMLNNLLDNALKYGEHIIILSMDISTDRKHFIIRIKNDGHLVPEDMQQKIFDPFFRWNRKRQIQGSGIGLFVSKSLAELHGGCLTFSIQEDCYNTFSLLLPVPVI